MHAKALNKTKVKTKKLDSDIKVSKAKDIKDKAHKKASDAKTKAKDAKSTASGLKA